MGTLFVSQRVLASIKGKLAKGIVPSQADITQLLDSSTLSEDEELVSIDLSILEIPSPDAVGSKQGVAHWTKSLVKKHGLKGTAELFVKAELDEAEDDEDEGDESEEAEVDVEEEKPEEAAHGNVANTEKATVQAKRAMMKCANNEADEEPGRKRPRAKAAA